MKYKFTRTVSHLEIAFGVLIIVAGVGAAEVAMLPTSVLGKPLMAGSSDDLPIRIATGLLIFLAGLVLGALFIVGGQLTLVFLDIARRVARIDRLAKLAGNRDGFVVRQHHLRGFKPDLMHRGSDLSLDDVDGEILPIAGGEASGPVPDGFGACAGIHKVSTVPDIRT
jgi:hypothetical protein